MDPIKATLSKHRIGAIMQRIKVGEPVEPEGSAWTLIDCLTVAGVLLWSAMSAGAATRPKSSGGRDAAAHKILQELQATIEFVGAMANAHNKGFWDEYFEPTVTIGIRADGGVTPLQGFKQ